MTTVPDPESGEVVYSGMRWNAPLSEEHAAQLLERMALAGCRDLLDLGCGWGELLLRAAAGAPSATGTAIDSDPWVLERGRRMAADRQLAERVRFLAGDAAGWRVAADRVLCIGASHAWGGSGEALRALSPLVRPGGRLLFGAEFWDTPTPGEAARAMFGEAVRTLGGLVDDAVEAGWRVLHVSTADQREWDDFESSWRAGRQEWLLAHADDERASDLRAKVDRQIRDYLGVYRGVLGFAFLILAR